jgi:ABC-type branched-subunit amino acid transport system substrate-binding protein
MHSTALHRKLHRKILRSGVLAAVCAGALCLAACASSASSSSSSGGSASANSSASTPFLIGAVQPLTGPFGTVGADILHATQAEANILNAKGGILGHKIKVIYADDGSDVQRGISATQQMVDNNKLNLFIPDAVNAQSQLPFVKSLLSFSNCSQAVCGNGSEYPLAFTTNPPASVQVPPLIAYAKKNGWTKIGVLAQDTSDGQFFTSQVQSLASAAGLDLVSTEYFDATATSITSQIQKLRAAGTQVIFGWTVGTTVGVAATGLQDLGWKVPLIGPPAIFTAPVNTLVPTSVYPQVTCLCYLVGTRPGASLSSVTAPLAKAMAPYGTINSLLVAGLSADGVALAAWAYDKAGTLNPVAAAKELDGLGADSNYPASELYVFRNTNPAYTATVHSPANAKLNDGFFGVSHPSAPLDGTYIGTPFNHYKGPLAADGNPPAARVLTRTARRRRRPAP